MKNIELYSRERIASPGIICYSQYEVTNIELASYLTHAWKYSFSSNALLGAFAAKVFPQTLHKNQTPIPFLLV